MLGSSSSSVMSPGPISLIPGLVEATFDELFGEDAGLDRGMKTNMACGLASRRAARTEQSPDFAAAPGWIRDLAARRHITSLERCLGLVAGRKVADQRHHSLMPFLIAQSAIITDDCAIVQLVRTK